MATNTKKVKGLQIPFKEFMPGQLIISSQFNDDMKDIEDKVNEIIEEHNVMSEEIDAHTDNTENPHQVNAHQVGTYDSGEIDEFVNDLRNGEFNDNVIENNVLADDCIDTRNYRDASITSSKVEPSFGSQLDISENIEIRTRYTKQETDELIKTKVGDGTYTKEELDTKFEEVQAGVIIDSTIGIEKLKPNVGNELDISRNVNIRNKYTKDEVDYLIKTNALPRDWGSILEADIDESFQSKDTGVIPAADYMIADMFVSPTSTALEFDIKEVADSRNGYDSLNDRLNASDTKISSLESSVNEFKGEVETAFLNTLEKVDTLEEISGTLDTQIKGINKQIFDNVNEVDSKIKKINTQLKQVDTSINNANTQISALTEKDVNHETNLNKLGSRIDTTSSQLQQVKSDVETLKTKPSVPVEIVQQVNKNTEDNKRQDIMLSGLFNENADGRLSTEENGNDIKLESSKQGLVEVEKVVGNTLVNRVSEQMRELTLNGNIDAEGTVITTTEGADKGLVDVMCEGNTLVNILKKEASKKTTSERFLIGKPTTVTVIRNEAVKTLLLAIYNKANDVWTTNISIPSNSLFTYTCSPDKYIGSVAAIINSNGNNTCFYSYDDYSNYPLTVLEGDYINKPIPTEYFEGMKSVGECADGSHKIEILSNNKNLWTCGDRQKTDTFYLVAKKYPLLKAGVYTISSKCKQLYDKPPYIDFRDINGNTMTFKDLINVYNITLPKDVYQIGLFSNGYNFTTSKENLIDFIEIQLEEGTQATSFVPHASNKKEILLNEPLRGLPSGTKDKFIKIDGKNVVKRVLDEKTFNGSSDEGWIINPTQPTETGSTHISFRTSEIPDAYNNNGYAELLCDKFKWNTNFHTNGELIKWANHKTQNMLVIVIQKSQLTSPNVDGLKKWLQANPIKVVYQLAKPIYEPLEIAPELLCYNEVTHISNNSLIPSNMKVKNTGFSCRALTSDGTYTVVHNGGEGVNSNVDTTDNMVRLSGKGKTVSDVMVLDGAVPKTYGSFEGMKSTFEDKLVTQEMVDKGLEKAENLGKYKVDITVRGKNKFVAYDELIDVKGISDIYITSANTEGATRVRIRTYDNYGNPLNTECLNSNALYKVKNENSYQLSNNMTKLDFRLSINSSVGYLQLTNQNGTWLEYNNIQIEEGTVATQYEPYKEYNTSVYLNSPLLKGDEICVQDGKLGHLHNSSDEIDYNNLIYHTTYEGFKLYECLLPNVSNNLDNSKINIISDNFNCESYDNRFNNMRELECYITKTKKLFIISNNKELNELKELVKNSKFIYQLAEPYFEKISDNKFMTEIPNNATLSIDSIIPCQSVKVSYTGNVPSVYGLEETGITNTNDIAATQTAVDFLLMSSMGEVMMMSFNENTRGGNNMGAYFASRIMKKALKYEDVIRKYPEFKEDIDFILRSEGYGDLIVEVQ